MSSSSQSNYLSFLALLVVLLSAIAVNAQSYRPVKRGICTKNMACKWAVCPYSRRHPIFVPTPDMCLIIDNEGCQCGSGQMCAVSDVMDPGQSSIKFEYRCRAGNWNGLDNIMKRAAPSS